MARPDATPAQPWSLSSWAHLVLQVGTGTPGQQHGYNLGPPLVGSEVQAHVPGELVFESVRVTLGCQEGLHVGLPVELDRLVDLFGLGRLLPGKKAHLPESGHALSLWVVTCPSSQVSACSFAPRSSCPMQDLRTLCENPAKRLLGTTTKEDVESVRVHRLVPIFSIT